MKKLLSLCLLSLCACIVLAQEQVRIWKQGDSKRFTTSELIFENDATSLIVGDSVYAPFEIDSITVVHTVTVTFAGDTAFVDHGHAGNVTDTIRGAHVKIVSTNTKSELEFVVQGESTHGSLTYEGPLKCKFYLNGLNLKSDKGAAIDIQCGKRVDLILNEGTENVLADAAGGEQKAALYCKGHLEVSGSGSLTVTGNAKHGIATKEYLELKKSTGAITVKKAVADAMHVGQYFLMNGGDVTITGLQGGDGLQVETLMTVTADNDTIPNPEKENNGQIIIRGGMLNVTANEDCSKGIKAPGDMTVSGGTVRVTANGDGTKGITVSGNWLVNQDTDTALVQVKATGDTYEDEDDDENDTFCVGLKVKGDFTVNAGTVQVSKNKKNFAYLIRLSKNSKYTVAEGATVTGTVSRTKT